MILTTELELNPQEFETFYNEQILKGEKSFQRKKITEILKSLILCVGGATFILVSSIEINLIPIGVTLFLFGCYYTYIWAKLEQSFRRTKLETQEQLNFYLNRLQGTETITITVDENHIHYYENGQHISASDWKYLSNLNKQDDHFYLIFEKLEQLIMIPKFAVSDIFYESLLSLAKNKFRISA